MKKHRKNNESDKDGIREAIYFASRWSFALFAAFAVLVGWVGKTAKAGEYDIFFWLGVAGIVGTLGGTIFTVWLTIHYIQQQRKPK